MDYRQTLDFLYRSLPVFQDVGGSAYKAGLDRIVALEEASGVPHRRFRSVHVAGTNGKGSVSHLIASALSAAGYRTGLFTSPHLKISASACVSTGRRSPSGRSSSTSSGTRRRSGACSRRFSKSRRLWHSTISRAREVDVAVVEVGMGGRLDSTNVIRPLLSVITNIGYDHTQFLGDTLGRIAGEKAGIVKEDTPVVVGESQVETKLVFIGRAKALRAPILFADQTYRVTDQRFLPDSQRLGIESLLDGNRFEVECDLQGIYQRLNVPTALTALDVLNGSGGLRIAPQDVRRGFASAARATGLRGRWERLGERPFVVCDTGHNESGIAEVAAQIARQTYRKLYMVVGFVEDKDLSRVLPLLPRQAHYVFTKAGIRRALDERELARRAAGYGLQGECVPTVNEALARARELAGPEDMIFIGGSTYVVAEVL
ncbi:MAG: bifunctional folylpolyglutamate synthase/dihydrofolate synthase [Alistipes ihumii]